MSDTACGSHAAGAPPAAPAGVLRPDTGGAPAVLAADLVALRSWLLEEALPLWSTAGFDPVHGGFEERLSTDALPLHEPRRARVQPRQIFALVTARRLGWRGELLPIISHTLGYFLRHYRRADGLYRTLVTREGACVDDTVWLYDQAFALLGFAAAAQLPGQAPGCEQLALQLLDRIGQSLGRQGAGFDSGLPQRLPLQSNPHLHLLEAALAWQALSADQRWHALADELVALALDHCLWPGSGLVHETFAADWTPAAGLAGRVIEPGHQYEWAWLLLQTRGPRQREARQQALHLIDATERLGIHHGVAVDALLAEGTVQRASARLWPQSERLRALATAAALTGEDRYWQGAHAAAQALRRYLNAAVPGLWHDELGPDGRFRIAPAPAGNLYHLSGAILGLEQAVMAKASAP